MQIDTSCSDSFCYNDDDDDDNNNDDDDNNNNNNNKGPGRFSDIKSLQQKYICVECKERRSTNNRVAPVTISKPLRKYLSNIPVKRDIKSYRKQPCWAAQPTYCRK
jgi:hypothetical protein